MERMKWIEDLDVRGVGTQGIVLDGGTTPICIASFRPAVSLPIACAGFDPTNDSFFPARC
jgi:hypothetical protein